VGGDIINDGEGSTLLKEGRNLGKGTLPGGQVTRGGDGDGGCDGALGHRERLVGEAMGGIGAI
jgi:hypothetical protein